MTPWPEWVTSLPFEKLHGAYNDFIFMEASHVARVHDLGALAQLLCHRKGGIGADGLILWKRSVGEKPTPSPQAQMLILNSDGTTAQTCGNALRCFGLLLMRHQLWDGSTSLPVFELHSETREKPFATLLHGVLEDGGRSARVTVGMGTEIAVRFLPIDGDFARGLAAFVEQNNLPPLVGVQSVFVELSNPHWVFASPGFAAYSPQAFSLLGAYCQTTLRQMLSPSLPVSNIGMLCEGGELGHALTVYERGAGLTDCCGSGAVAARVALETLGRLLPQDNVVKFRMPGGEVAIGRAASSAERTLAGPAAWVASGST